MKINANLYSDLDRFVDLGLPSIRKWLPTSWIREFVIVAPKAQVRQITEALSHVSDITFRVLDESLCLSPKANAVGWVTQQLLKLGAGFIVEDEWILMLDCDVIVSRLVREEDLFVEGLAVAHMEQQANRGWMTASLNLLGADGPADLNAPVMGVTPQLLHGPTLRALCARVGEIAGDGEWQAHLVRHRGDVDHSWTEYSLYWSFVTLNGLAGQLYSDKKTVLYLRKSIWTRKRWNRMSPESLREAFDPDSDHAFFIVQSNINIPLSSIIRVLYPYVHGHPYGDRAFLQRHLVEFIRAPIQRVARWIRRP